MLYTIAGMGVIFVAAMLFARSQMHPLSNTPASAGSAPTADSNHHETPELVALHSKMLDERLGNDDGFALDIFYGGSLDGSLETCG